MYSSTTCAFSGAFIIAGGLCATMWIFIRALSMNLQICWDIVPGKKFFYLSQAFGWGIPAVLFAATMTVTGVSFRFGAACHVNHVSSMADFWGPLMAIAGAAGILQIATFGYCVKVYLKNLWSDSPANSTSASGSGLPSYSNSMRTQTARAVYQRLKKVLWLQWRGISIVTIILVDVIFFVIVFVSLDGIQNRILHDIRRIEPWLICLVANAANKDQCLDLVQGWLVNESTVVAVLFLLGLSGLQVTLFLARPSVFPAWADFFRNRFGQRQEFVSLDARPDNMRTHSKAELLRMERGHQATTFEMQKPSYSSTMATEPESLHLDMKSLETSATVISSPSESYRSPLRMEPSLDLPYGHDRMSPALDHGNTPPSMATTSTFPQQRQIPETYSRNPRHYQPHEYFHFPQSRSPPPDDGFISSPTTLGGHTSLDRGGEPERTYQAPGSSFSAPKTPSRQSSLRSTACEPRDVWAGRGGLALNPPSEAGESVEDLHHERRVDDTRDARTSELIWVVPSKLNDCSNFIVVVLDSTRTHVDNTQDDYHITTYLLSQTLCRTAMMLSVAKTLALVKRTQQKERLAELKRVKDHRELQRLRCKAKERPTPPPDHLFTLPPELRLQIYAETFRRDFINARPQDTSRGSRRKFLLRVISLLRVCGQVRREALDVFSESLKEEVTACRAFARSPKKHWDGSLCATRCQYHDRKAQDLLWHVSYLQELQEAVKVGEVFCRFAARTTYQKRSSREVLDSGKRFPIIPVHVTAEHSDQAMEMGQATKERLLQQGRNLEEARLAQTKKAVGRRIVLRSRTILAKEVLHYDVASTVREVRAHGVQRGL
nr:hypothetical protein B0A51_15686 [Rachicladosporium sp. CCFEE 5018]